MRYDPLSRYDYGGFHRVFEAVPPTFSDSAEITLPLACGPLIKSVIEEFCPRWVPGGQVVYIGDTEDKFRHLDAAYLKTLGVEIDSAAKMPDIVVHDTKRDWLVLIEAVSTAGPVDTKRRGELKELFSGCRSGLVFVTAFADRATMQSFVSSISWESEVWIADAPDHLVHFNGERYLGPYPDVSAES